MCLSKNISLVYADIFKYPTVRELAALVDDDGVTEAAQSKNEFSDLKTIMESMLVLTLTLHRKYATISDGNL